MSFVYLDKNYSANTQLIGDPANRMSRYLVGFYDPNGNFYVVESFERSPQADTKINFLNGGNKEKMK